MNKQRPLLLVVLLLYIFAPSIVDWVSDPGGDWYRPFIVWLLVIGAAFALQSWEKSNDV